MEFQAQADSSREKGTSPPVCPSPEPDNRPVESQAGPCRMFGGPSAPSTAYSPVGSPSPSPPQPASPQHTDRQDRESRARLFGRSAWTTRALPEGVFSVQNLRNGEHGGTAPSQALLYSGPYHGSSVRTGSSGTAPVCPSQAQRSHSGLKRASMH